MVGAVFDFGGIASLFDMLSTMRAEAANAARNLSAMSHAKAVELAGQKLHSRRKMFVDALHLQQVDDGAWFLQLDAKAVFIEDGLPDHDMLPNLLKSPKVKVSKTGNRYLIIPFDHSPGGDHSASQQPMVDAVRSALKQRGIPFGKIERGMDGKALTGTLHRLDITNAPLKTGFGAGQGWGPQGAPRQGPNARQIVGGGPGGGGVPFLQGLRISQSMTAAGGVKRSITTFRVASSSQLGQGRWHHPGIEGAGILTSTFEWMEQCWEREILPALLERLERSL